MRRGRSCASDPTDPAVVHQVRARHAGALVGRADLSTKHAFLKDGVGWGGMPLHMIAQDIAAGTLVVLDVDDMPRSGFILTMSAWHRASQPPGPAGQWFVEHLKALWRQDDVVQRP